MRLTHPRSNGIKSGYWTPEKKDSLTQKLGPIEERLPDLLDQICDHYCLHAENVDNQEILTSICDECPLNTIDKLID